MPAELEIAVELPSSLGADATLELHNNAADVDVATPLLGPSPAFGPQGAMPYLTFTRTPLGTGILGAGILGGVPPYPSFLPLGSGFLGDGFLGAGGTRFKFLYQYVWAGQSLSLKVVARDRLGNRTGIPYVKTMVVSCPPRPPLSFEFASVVGGMPRFAVDGSPDESSAIEIRVYRRTTPTGTPTLVATLDNDDVNWTDLSYPGGLCYYSALAVYYGQESSETEQERVNISGGANIGPVANAPILSIYPYKGGMASWRFMYQAVNQQAAPVMFQIVYTTDGSDPTSASTVLTPPGTIPYTGAYNYQKESTNLQLFPAQTTGTVIKARVMATTAGGAQTLSAVASCVCDAQGPASPDFAIDTTSLKW